MNYSVTHSSGEILLDIGGELDANTAPSLRPTLDEIVDRDEPNITVNLSNLRLIDSSGVGALVFLYKRASAAGRRFRIVGLTEQPATILRLLRLDTILAAN